MDWYKLKEKKLKRYRSSEIWCNDDNIIPNWIENRVKYSEFHVFNESQDIFINIGESWTYGENVKDIASGIRRYNLNTQLEHTFGPVISRKIDTDFYQYAVPGNSNGNMIKELERILSYITQNFTYRKIYLSVQITEPSREQAQLNEFAQDHPIHTLYRKNQDINFQQWLVNYDEIFLALIDDIIKKYTNVDCIVWKNFCKWNTNFRPSGMKIIEKNWIERSAEILKIPYETLSFQSIGWFNDIYNHRKFYGITVDENWAMKEMEKIERSNNFLLANDLHSMHPNHKGHAAWAEFLLENSRWLNE